LVPTADGVESLRIRGLPAQGDLWRTPIVEGRTDPLRRKLVWVALVVTLAGAGVPAFVGTQNHDRAEGRRRRAVTAEEVVSGQRIVIGQRSQALNLRTTQANRLATISSAVLRSAACVLRGRPHDGLRSLER
jgi:hypothetical protein